MGLFAAGSGVSCAVSDWAGRGTQATRIRRPASLRHRIRPEVRERRPAMSPLEHLVVWTIALGFLYLEKLLTE